MNKAVSQNKKFIYVLEGLLFSYIITAIILLIVSFLMLNFDLSGSVISAIINVTYIVSTFMGGFFVGKKTEQKKFVWGLVVGVFYFIILMLVSLLMNRVGPIPIGSLITVFIITGLGGMLGGMIS
ncbi:MAG TPA: TIGR04086 family membrane protein [Mobilitalea sp.]|nr:TIGR04086 family membrane protein [Mobilitalea sp.]